MANQIATEIPAGHVRRETGRAMVASHFTDFHDPFRPFFVGEPFEAVWIESVRGPLFTLVQNDKHIYVNALKVWKVNDMYLTIAFADGMTGLASLITKEETSPESYRDSPIHSFLFGFFQKMAKKGQPGAQRVNERLRIGEGKDRRLIKIKDIVHIRLKTENLSDPGESRDIEWSHRWEVMGHWRKVSGIGKDNLGSYCVNGYTWVTPHVRGPEEKELVKKTRIIMPPKVDQ